MNAYVHSWNHWFAFRNAGDPGGEFLIVLMVVKDDFQVKRQFVLEIGLNLRFGSSGLRISKGQLLRKSKLLEFSCAGS